MPSQIERPAWVVRVLRAETDMQYIWITLEYTCRASMPSEFRPEAVTLVCVDDSPLRGLARAPLLYRDTQCGGVIKVTEQSLAIRLQPGERRRGALAFATQGGCTEFGLYAPGCDVIPLRLDFITN